MNAVGIEVGGGGVVAKTRVLCQLTNRRLESLITQLTRDS